MNDVTRYYKELSMRSGEGGEMSKNNLQLWESVQNTDPKYTKNYKGAGGFQGTSINATYIVKRITEKFGQVGTGWGYDVLEERYDQGGPILNKDGATVCNAAIHTVKIRLWYQPPGEDRKHVDHYGHTPFVYANKYGVQTELEPSKKSVTDALKKAASMLGFGSDIHLGMFEDLEYLQEAQNESQLAHAEDKVEELRRQQEEYEEYLAKHIGYIETSTTIGELEKIFTAAVRRAQSKKDQKGIIKLTKAKDHKKAELSGENDND